MIERVLFSEGEILTMSHRDATQPKVGWVGVEGLDVTLVTYDRAEAMSWAEGDDLNGESVETQIIECAGSVVMPGLINTHSHISMTLLRNYADDMDLHSWLNDYIWPFESHLTTEDIYNGARLAIVEMLLGGTTTFVDMYFDEHIIARAVKELGIRALLTETAIDGAIAEGFTAKMDLLMAAAEGEDRVMAGVAPHAPYTCSPETLKMVVDYATKHNLPIHTHLSETAIEREITQGKYGLSPLEYFEANGVITPRTILAHSIYLTDDEIDRVAKSGASVAHNAQSNMKLASGIAPIAEMSRRGVNCSIATDGASSNNDLDMWDEMRSAALLQRVHSLSPTEISAYEMLWMATRGGAAAIGREDLGEIACGKRADIVVVDMSKPHNRPRHNLLSALLYSVKSSDVRDVMIGGEFSVVNREITRGNVEAIISAADSSVSRILSEL